MHKRPDTSPENLIKEIMSYKVPFTSKYTQWGSDMESSALEMYVSTLCGEHLEMEMKKCGLYICQTMPYLAASPDGIRQCKCHGKVLVEIKCPFKYKDRIPTSLVGLDDFYLDNNSNLKKSHKYYTQVQLQMSVTNINSCDFVVFTERGILVTQVTKDEEFCKSAVTKATQFFFTEVMPELICHKVAKSMPVPPVVDRSICFCGKPPTKTRIITCSSPDCSVTNFHYKCIGINRKPAFDWFCPLCRSKNT